MEQIPQDVAKERFNRLLALVQQEGRIRSSRFEGSVQEVLVEEESREKEYLQEEQNIIFLYISREQQIFLENM